MLDRRGAIAALGSAIAGAPIRQVAAAARGYDGPEDLYGALRSQPAEHVVVDGGLIDLVFADGAPGLDRGLVQSWLTQAIDSVSGYFGCFPVARYGLLVLAEPGDRVGHATTFGYAGPATRIHVGVGAKWPAFARDWVLVHELLHAALPNLPRRALWLQEGNATWLEPVLRARAGHLPESEIWRQSILGLTRGRPGPADGGLDGTLDHERLYWGGATFWLLAEIAIAQATDGQRSLRDAVRAISRESGGNSVVWTPERMMSVGDAATSSDVFGKLYTRFAYERVDTDPAALFARLGVSLRDGQVDFDERAPLAALRRCIVGRNRKGGAA